MTQSGWRWCQKCQGTFFAGNPSQGVCPADHGSHDASRSAAYALPEGDGDPAFARADLIQTGWRWCHKCQGLFFANNASQGVCPADNQSHDSSESEAYNFWVGDGTIFVATLPIMSGQKGWRWCRKCQGMFFTENPNQGVCPAGQAHDGSGSWRYTMLWDIPKPASITRNSTFLTCPLPLGGTVNVQMIQNGDYNFAVNAYDSGFDNIDYTVSALLMSTTGYAFTFQHSGSVEGTIAGLPFGTPRRSDNWVGNTTNNPSITNNWDSIISGSYSARIGGTDTIVKGIVGVLGTMVSSAAASLGQAAAKGIIALA
jgi:hypothetical protein